MPAVASATVRMKKIALESGKLLRFLSSNLNRRCMFSVLFTGLLWVGPVRRGTGKGPTVLCSSVVNSLRRFVREIDEIEAPQRTTPSPHPGHL